MYEWTRKLVMFCAIELDHIKAYILTRSTRCVFIISTITKPNKSFSIASVASNLIRFSKYISDLLYGMIPKVFLSFDPLDFSSVHSLFLVLLLFRENGSKMILFAWPILEQGKQFQVSLSLTPFVSISGFF